jgi:hypothetical protein
MNYNYAHNIPTDIREIESIVDILEREMAATRANPEIKEPSNELDLLVADLLGYLAIEN